MNLLELNDDELKSFLEDGIPLNFLRDIYVNTPKLAQKLKGFRPNKAAQQVLVNTSYTLIRNQKDGKLIGILTKYYNDYNLEIKEAQKKYEMQGYSETIAMAMSIEESTNENFRPIYFKLEHFDETMQKTINENINILSLIKTISSDTTRDSLKKELDKLNKGIEVQLKSINDNVEKLKKQISEYKVANESLKDDLRETKQAFGNINNEDLRRSIEEVNKKFDVTIKKEREAIEKKIERLVQNDVVMKLQDQIDFLKQYIEKSNNQNSSRTFSINIFENKEYEEFDEYLSENIGDIIENIANNSEFDALREYLVEIIYSKKPIIVSEKNYELLANILSSIITGGNYYEIIAEDNCDFGQLISEVDNLERTSNNKVVVFKNIINIQSYQRVLDYIKTRPFNEKFLFVISYDREIQFLAPEILDDFNFFIGKFDSKNILYKYAYSFENDNRQAITNKEFDKTLNSLELSLDNKEIMNVNYYGLLSYSIIPFKSIHDSIDIEDLVNKILNQNIRLKCEAILHD